MKRFSTSSICGISSCSGFINTKKSVQSVDLAAFQHRFSATGHSCCCCSKGFSGTSPQQPNQHKIFLFSFPLINPTDISFPIVVLNRTRFLIPQVPNHTKFQLNIDLDIYCFHLLSSNAGGRSTLMFFSQNEISAFIIVKLQLARDLKESLDGPVECKPGLTVQLTDCCFP